MMFSIGKVGINPVIKQDFAASYGTLELERAKTGGFRHDGKDPDDA
jgi:hypothetical protein